MPAWNQDKTSNASYKSHTISGSKYTRMQLDLPSERKVEEYLVEPFHQLLYWNF
jgi:hypothetical protein